MDEKIDYTSLVEQLTEKYWNLQAEKFNTRLEMIQSGFYGEADEHAMSMSPAKLWDELDGATKHQQREAMLELTGVLLPVVTDHLPSYEDGYVKGLKEGYDNGFKDGRESTEEM